jgi:hypothetical protein
MAWMAPRHYLGFLWYHWKQDPESRNLDFPRSMAPIWYCGSELTCQQMSLVVALGSTAEQYDWWMMELAECDFHPHESNLTIPRSQWLQGPPYSIVQRKRIWSQDPYSRSQSPAKADGQSTARACHEEEDGEAMQAASCQPKEVSTPASPSS